MELDIQSEHISVCHWWSVRPGRLRFTGGPILTNPSATAYVAIRRFITGRAGSTPMPRIDAVASVMVPDVDGNVPPDENSPITLPTDLSTIVTFIESPAISPATYTL